MDEVSMDEVRVLQWLVDTRNLLPEARETKQLETVVSLSHTPTPVSRRHTHSPLRPAPTSPSSRRRTAPPR